MKLVTLNIEGDKHLAEVFCFLHEEKADVVCLQEVFEVDLEYIKEQLGMPFVTYAPLMRVDTFPNIGNLAAKGIWGIGIFSNMKPEMTDTHYYVGDGKNLPMLGNHPNTNHRAVAVVQVHIDGAVYTIATTHLTWARPDEISSVQLNHVDMILTYLSQYDDYILCGDFNAPRGMATYQKLAGALTDHLPETVVSTTDPILHRVNGLSLVVDSVFSTPQYNVSDIRVKGGLSDHKAIVVEVSKIVKFE